MTTYEYIEKPKRKLSEMPLAGLGSRIAAIIVDTLILGFAAGLLFGGGRGVGGALWLVLMIAYQWYFLTQHNGQTPGKMLLGIRVVKVDGSPLTAADTILRTLGYSINSMVMMIGWLWAFFDADRQGWHDKIARTVVVQAR
jgi:uncharacterized RDD family membrane protein YckC